MSTRRDRGFRIAASSFSFRGDDIIHSNISSLLHVHTSLGSLYTLLVYRENISTVRREEDVGVGLGSRFGRNGLFRTSS
jgi:hypothetical protein